ncbi:LacI family transcriptional regulator [Gleimia sp. 6138-11-ORH1]|uniref:LacI family DNA-binding transcriptional regulator n=1 Tax=Gleimia sp. 6138-11-ORH1 TaxID=2973937 RepID=UPI002168838E|nr:LacI family DNA-binding transcriptional regulator [Gleimia sp. 6138-11-ORH1]MCS4485173.1 LacI family transcriptional regulator [Gleimia sp. 6138-11-ORH1]
MKRVTIKDIARAAKVSPTAVSFALNDKPGISAQTRERILTVAASMGWSPNPTARALSASKTNTIGLVIPRPNTSHLAERFYFNFIVGLQTTLHSSNYELLLHLADSVEDELETYRLWWAQRKVDGVVVVNPQEQDPRSSLLESLELPAVAIGDSMPGASAVLANDAQMMVEIAKHLVSREVSSLAYICGAATRLHAKRRITSLRNFAKTVVLSVEIASNTDFTEYAGYTETTKLLEKANPPQALIFENEILALGGLQALYDNDLTPGKQILLVSCEDSPICRVVKPSISAISRNPATLGEHAAQVLVSVLDGQPPHTVSEETPNVIVRDSSANNLNGTSH